MKNFIILTVAICGAFFLGTTFYYYSPLYPSITKAIAVVNPTQGNTASGVVTFEQQKDGLHITAQLSGLTPGNHGFHIHEFGNCACPDAVCAGDHYNPTSKPHGSQQDKNRHVGDLGNIIADSEGNGTYETIDHHVTLNGPYSIIGRAVIVHADEDDFTTQPTGNSGARIGAGVIGIAKK